MRTIKCVVVGDGDVGKTSLVTSYVKSEFPMQQVPTAFESYSMTVQMDGKSVRLSLWDTAGQDDYDKLRPLSYPQTDMAIVCFSVMNPASFGNVKSKWHNEMKTYCPEAILLLVGTKCDLRSNEEAVEKLRQRSLRPVTCPQGVAMAKDIGAVKYLQCSALTHTGVENVFEEAIRAAINPMCSMHRKKNCKQCSPKKHIGDKHCVVL